MAAWASPLHFRVHATCRTGTKLRTEPQREDEEKWDWVIPYKEAGCSTPAQSSGSSDTRPDKEKWERAGQKTGAASNTAAKSAGSDDKRPNKQQLDRAKPKNERRVTRTPTTAVQSFQGAPWCSKAEPNWQPWQPVPWQCKLKTPSAGRSPCGTGFFPRQALPQPPKRWMMGGRRTNGVPSRSSDGWSCRKCSTIFSTPSTSGLTLGDRRALAPRQRCWNR